MTRTSMLALAAMLTGAFVFGEIRVGPTRVAALRRGAATVSGAYYGTASVYSTSTDVVTDGIVAWWRLDDNAATADVLDSSGNGYHGTLTGLTQDSSVPGATGLGLALSFAVAGEYVETATQPSLTDSFSVSLWVNFSPIWNIGPLVGNNEDINHDTTGWCFFQAYDGFYLQVNSGYSVGENEVQVKIPMGLNDGVWEHMNDAWHHCVVTFSGVSSGNLVTFYFDGAQRVTEVQEANLTIFPSAMRSLRIGASTGSQYYGALDDIRIYDRVLTPEEAVEIYTFYSGNPAPPPPPLDTITVTFDCQGSGYADYDSAQYTAGTAFGSLPSAYNYDGSYSFYYWRDDNYTSYDASSVAPASDLTLYPEWYYSPSSYTLYFDAQGGSSDMYSTSIYYGSPYGSYGWPGSVYMDGYEFGGWYTDYNGGGSYRGPDDYFYGSGDETVYAYWAAPAPSSATLYFDASGGYVDPTSVSVNMGSYYEDAGLPTPSYEGYTFAGWYSSANGTVVGNGNYYSVYGDDTLTAQWQ